MPTKKQILDAIRTGEAMAAATLAKRKKAMRARAKALKALSDGRVRGRKAELRAAVVSAGTLVAEGDSWFDYPFFDVISILEDEYGYDVETVAHMGDTVEEMAFAGGQLYQFTKKIEKLVLMGRVPRAILLSGGGNDVAGEGFAMLLNHAAAPNGGLNQKVVDGILNDRIAVSYATILKSVTDVCVALAGCKIPIITHGYDYPIPDGRGYWGGAWVLPGPWLEPGLRQKGFSDLAARYGITKTLIDRFNDMLQGIVAVGEFSHVRYVNLRGVLPATLNSYKNWWDNELHPTKKGFRKIAEKIHAKI